MMASNARISVGNLSRHFEEDPIYSQGSFAREVINECITGIDDIQVRHLLKVCPEQTRLSVVIGNDTIIDIAKHFIPCDWVDGHDDYGTPKAWSRCKNEVVSMFSALEINLNVVEKFFSGKNLPIPKSLSMGNKPNTECVRDKLAAGLPDGVRYCFKLDEVRNAMTAFRADTDSAIQEREVEAQTHEENVYTSQEFVEHLRETETNDERELAKRVKAQFPRLSDSDIGKLLPANPGSKVGWHAENARGRRLLGKKK